MIRGLLKYPRNFFISFLIEYMAMKRVKNLAIISKIISVSSTLWR